MGYEVKTNGHFKEKTVKCGELRWNLEGPLKTIIFLWLYVSNKILTWNNSQKKNWNGSSKCVVCKDNNKLVDYLLHHISLINLYVERSTVLTRQLNPLT